MEYEKTSIQRLEEGKIIRIDDKSSRKTVYLEVNSKNFPCQLSQPFTPRIMREYHNAPYLAPYFKRRQFLFSKFDEGIHYDEESLYSIIPEAVSLYLQDRFKKCGIRKICQPFSGVGGIAVHLCSSFDEYVVNDLDKGKIKKLKKNLRVYGKKEHLLKYFETDFLAIQPFATDCLIICPPWGGINVAEYAKSDLDLIMKPRLSDIINHGLLFCENILIQMPKNTNIENFISIFLKCNIKCPFLTVEKILRNGKQEQLFIYMGNPKFTGISIHINEVIYRDLGLSGQKYKHMRKKVKEELKINPLEVCSRVYKTKYPKKEQEDEQDTEHPDSNVDQNIS